MEPWMKEITPAEAEAIRRRGLPEGVEIRERDEVLFWDKTYARSSSGLYVPEAYDPIEDLLPPPPAPLVGVDLFSGCGGFSLGMHWAGINVAAAVEWDTTAAYTYLHNLGHPECRIGFATPKDEDRWRAAMRKGRKQKDRAALSDEGEWIGTACRASEGWGDDKGCHGFMFGDATAIRGEQLLELAGIDHVDVVFGGPPCQGLSTANAKACLEDPRNGMLWEFLRLVEELEPRTFIIENVPQILTAAKGGLFSALVTRANAAGYDVVAQKINASWHGVPQHRVRALIVGTAASVARPYQFPMPSTWGLGRMADGRNWSFLTDEGIDGPKRALPTPAVFDADSRTWRTADVEAEALDEEESERQPDLFAAVDA